MAGRTSKHVRAFIDRLYEHEVHATRAIRRQGRRSVCRSAKDAELCQRPALGRTLQLGRRSGRPAPPRVLLDLMQVGIEAAISGTASTQSALAAMGMAASVWANGARRCWLSPCDGDDGLPSPAACRPGCFAARSAARPRSKAALALSVSPCPRRCWPSSGDNR
jgi:hypothetical protein